MLTIPQGVNGIFHTASPIDLSLTDYSHFITPAILGNEAILESGRKAGPQLSSVVITSSAAAVFDGKKPAPYVFTEADFARSSLEKAEADRKEGVKTNPGMLYGASKVAAERAVWKWRDEHKVSSPFPSSPYQEYAILPNEERYRLTYL